MKNSQKWIALVLALSALSWPQESWPRGKRRPDPAPEPAPTITMTATPSPSSSPTILPVPSEPGAQKVQFVPVEYYTTPAQRAKIAKAGILVNKVVQSQCFYDFMVNRKLIQTEGRTPLEVGKHLQGISGVVPVKMYYRCYKYSKWQLACTTAVAYRQPPSMEINLNSAVFDPSDSDCEWAETIAHESLGHSLGEYGHDYRWSPSRSYSVPYSIGGGDAAQGGSAFGKCCKALAQ